jgi:hypothetical protein
LIGLVVVVVIVVALVAVTQFHLLDLLFPCGGEGQPLC